MRPFILKAKLQKPQLTHASIKREKLLNRMLPDAYRVITLSCQTGYGKSTLMSQWLETYGVDFIWYALDDLDDDFQTFMMYLTQGIKRIDAELGDRLESLQSQIGSLSTDRYMRMYTSLLYELKESIWLVLDDFHHIQNEALLEALSFLMTFLEDQIGFVFLSREKINLNLTKQYLKGNVLALDTHDLVFDRDDIESLILTSDVLEGGLKNTDAVYKITEGWAAGVRLAMIVMEKETDVRFEVTGMMDGHEDLMKYLFEEVLKHLSTQQKHFLMISTIPEYFTREMCEGVFSIFIKESDVLLEEILHKNMFVIRSGQDYFRYHHLFRKVMQSYHKGQVGGDYQVKVYAVMHAIGNWHYGKGQYLEAVKTYTFVEDFMAIAKCLEHLWAPMDLALTTAKWLDLIKDVPEEIIMKRPVLAMAYGWSLIDNNRIEAAEYWLDQAESVYNKTSLNYLLKKDLVSDQTQYELMNLHLLRARAYILGARGDVEGLFVHADRLTSLMNHQNLNKYGVIMMAVAFAYWAKGDLNAAEIAFEKAITYEREYGDSINVDNFKMVLYTLWLHQKRYEMVCVHANQLIDEIKQIKRLPLLLATLYLLDAQGASGKGAYERCNDSIKQARIYGNQYALPDFEYRYYAFKCHLALEHGDLQSAMVFANEAKAHYFQNPIPDFNPIAQIEETIRGQKNNEAEGDEVSRANEGLIEPLTARELEVLTLIELGMSNKEICQTLFLALSTVKGYIQNIFGKLGVKRRTEAVAKAKMLRIL